MRLLILLFLWAIISNSIHAQDTNLLKTITISDNRIETTLQRSGRSIHVIHRKEIEALPVQSVNDLLQYVGGVDLRQRGAWGAQADISLRGGSFDQTLILVNGIKVSDPQTGHHNLNLGFDLEAIDRVEIIKGPAAARYGLNSFSGVINIITQAPAENAAEVRTSFGMSEDAKVNGPFYAGYRSGASLHLGSTRSRHSISATTTQSAGYRPNTDLNRTGVNYLSNTQSSLGNFQAMGSVLSNKFGASGFYAFPIDSSSEEEVTTYLAALQHEVSLGKIQLRSKLYSRKNFDTYTLFREAPEIYQNQHRTDVEGAELHTSISSKLGMSGIGLEYRRESINSNNLGLWVRQYGGLFGEHRIELFDDRLAIQGGGYLNYLHSEGFQLLPSASINYTMLPSTSLYANIGRGFRMPTFTDLYYVGPTNLGNPNLKPEQSIQLESGVKIKRYVHLFEVGAFYQKADDLIDWVRDSVTVPWQPRNYETVATQGVEVNYSLFGNRTLITDVLNLQLLRLSYTYLYMHRLGTEAEVSRYAFNNLRHQAIAQTGFQLMNRWSLTASARYNDRRAYQDYILLDARIQFKNESTRLWLDVTNLLDEQYIEAANAPMPGRWYRIGFEVKIW